MKKAKSRTPRRDIRAEYDFAKGIRGKYADRFARGTNLVKLDADVAAVFSDSASVNEALRTLTEVARRALKRAV